MKKLLIFTIALVLFGFTAVNAINVVGSIGGGTFCQKGSDSYGVVNVMLQIPFFQSGDSTYGVLNQSSYAYSEFKTFKPSKHTWCFGGHYIAVIILN